MNPDIQESTLVDEKAFRLALFFDRASWFVTLRWGVVATFILLAFGAKLGLTLRIGLRLEPMWLLTVGAGLALANALYFIYLKNLSRDDIAKVGVLVNAQILIDLLAVTVVVHKAGSLSTYAPFLYSIHIVLSCIFFSARTSLYILLLSCGLYIGCVFAEHVGILAPTDSILNANLPAFSNEAKVFHVLSAITIWSTVWFLASQLSRLIRERNRELDKAHNRVKEMFDISQHHMHQTAHQMKSPLAAIQSNLLLLEMHLGDDLDDRAKDLMKRTHVRSENLHEQVRDILHLANLKAGDQVNKELIELDISELLENCITGLEGNAEGRNVIIKRDLEPIRIKTDHDVLKVIFDNLISNAINYSHEGGTVTVSCKPDGDTTVVNVSDEGIGIPEDKLDQIFEDFFRTDSAKKHCRYSTGMGLAIVKHAAESLNIQICVESKEGEGTTFTLGIPSNSQTTG